MSRRDEVGARGRCVQPLVQPALRQLDDPVALGADEVVMVALAAEAVARLERVVRERVDDPVLGEGSERPVDGREADALSRFPEPAVELLRRHVVRLPCELLEHADALLRDPQARACEPLEHPGLTRLAHVAYASTT